MDEELKKTIKKRFFGMKKPLRKMIVVLSTYWVRCILMEWEFHKMTIWLLSYIKNQQNKEMFLLKEV